MNFDPRHFGSTFQENKINGFDIMIMDSAERADKIIKEIKERINYYLDNKLLIDKNFEFQYSTDGILISDQYRIEKELKRFCASKGITLD